MQYLLRMLVAAICVTEASSTICAVYTEDGGVCWWSGCHISVTDRPLLTPGAPGLIPGCLAAILITSKSLYITLAISHSQSSTLATTIFPVPR